MNGFAHQRTGDGVRRLGGVTLAIGSVLVVITSLLYANLPPAATAQVLQAPSDAVSTAAAAASAMRVAGTVGIVGNPVMAVGAFLLASDACARGVATSACGWWFVALSLVIFELVDGILGYALPVAAATSPAGFEAFRGLYAAYFLTGTLVFGVGGVLAVRPVGDYAGWRRWIAWVAFLDAAVAIPISAAGLAGWNVADLVGLVILVGALVFALVGLIAFGEARAG